MKKLFIALMLVALLLSCEKEEFEKNITLGDYPLKEYYLERDPKVNVWGAGMDLIHCECALPETELDYTYLEKTDEFPYDLKFFIVKSYYSDGNGDLQIEGCPAIILSPEAKACKVGAGITFFNNLKIVTEDMTAKLKSDYSIDYKNFKNETTGFYEREQLYAALDLCIIGQSFRSNLLDVPDTLTEQDVQPVYLIETNEGGYAKFMVKQFKAKKPNEKQTLMHWQVISE